MEPGAGTVEDSAERVQIIAGNVGVDSVVEVACALGGAEKNTKIRVSSWSANALCALCKAARGRRRDKFAQVIGRGADSV